MSGSGHAPPPPPGKRGKVDGWSPAAARRNSQFLWSVDTDQLTGEGWAFSLTLKDCPPDHLAWDRCRRTFLQWLRDNGALRWHWVVEWQRRGVPHLHLAVYWPEGTGPTIGVRAIEAWLRAAAEYGPHPRAQDGKPITRTSGWLAYLAKHAVRGVSHYQRQGKPPGWEKTGRLWGKGGDWPTADPVRMQMTAQCFYRYRRLVASKIVAEARAEVLRLGEAAPGSKQHRAALRRLSWARRARKADKQTSGYRGRSDWVSQTVALRLASHAGWDGELRESAAA